MTVLAEIHKSSREFIRISLRRDGRAVRVDVRVFELHQKAPAASTSRGFAIRPDILPAVIAALVAAKAAINGEGESDA